MRHPDGSSDKGRPPIARAWHALHPESPLRGRAHASRPKSPLRPLCALCEINDNSLCALCVPCAR